MSALVALLHEMFNVPSRGMCGGTHSIGYGECQEVAARLHAAGVRVTGDDLDNAYRERNAVVAALIRTNGWPASLMAAPDAEGWWVVYAETPQGQVSWHVHPNDVRLFDDVPRRGADWDGHDTDTKYERVAALVRVTGDAGFTCSCGHGEDDHYSRCIHECECEAERGVRVTREAGLDVERLAMALHTHGCIPEVCAPLIAREYAALAPKEAER